MRPASVPARNPRLGLPRNAAFDARIAQQLKQSGVVNRRAIHERQHHAAAHAADRFAVRDLREIGCGRAFKHERKARIERIGHTCRAAQAGFLLLGKAEPGVDRRLILQQRQQRRTAHAVVDRLGLDQAVAKLNHCGIEHAEVAKGYFDLRGSACGGADVDIQVFGLGMVRRSAAVVRCTALMPITPVTSPKRTARPITTRGSTPPTSRI